MSSLGMLLFRLHHVRLVCISLLLTRCLSLRECNQGVDCKYRTHITPKTLFRSNKEGYKVEFCFTCKIPFQEYPQELIRTAAIKIYRLLPNYTITQFYRIKGEGGSGRPSTDNFRMTTPPPRQTIYC